MILRTQIVPLDEAEELAYLRRGLTAHLLKVEHSVDLGVHVDMVTAGRPCDSRGRSRGGVDVACAEAVASLVVVELVERQRDGGGDVGEVGGDVR